jgi:hypothetical protein
MNIIPIVFLALNNSFRFPRLQRHYWGPVSCDLLYVKSHVTNTSKTAIVPITPKIVPIISAVEKLL